MDEKPLTIALPAYGFFPNLGGGEIGLHNVAKRLKARGHRPVVVAPWTYAVALRRRGVSLPYEVKAFPPALLGRYARYPEGAQKGLNLFYDALQARFRFDVAHINYAFPVGVSFIRWQARAGRTLPFLIQSVGEDIQKQPEIGYGLRLDPAIEALVQRWLPCAPMVTAVSESVRDEFRGLGVPDRAVRMVPYGVDARRFGGHRTERTKEDLFGFPPGTFVFLCVGRNHPKKNFEQPLRALAQLVAAGRTDLRLVYVGNGVDALKDAAEGLGLTPYVAFFPPPPLEKNRYDDIPAAGLLDYYHLADAFLMPSITETFGIVIAEAMASGLPVVVADAPGCRDVTDHGKYALTYRLDQDRHLAKHMVALADSPDLRARYRGLSRDRAWSFDWDAVTEMYLACYAELLDRPR